MLRVRSSLGALLLSACGYCARFEGSAAGRPPRKDAGAKPWPSAR